MTTAQINVRKNTWNIFRSQSKWTLDQINSREEIVAKPINHCAQGISKGTPRHQVPSSGKVMRVVTGRTPAVGTEPMLTSAKIDNLVGRVADTDEPLPVISDGQLMGEIDRSVVMHPKMSIS